MKNALENRIVGTKSRGVYEAPAWSCSDSVCGRYIRPPWIGGHGLFQDMSRLVANQIYDAGISIHRRAQPWPPLTSLPPSRPERQGRLVQGQYLLHELRDCAASIYNEADSSMEASEGLNPTSSQGFAEIQSVESPGTGPAGQIKA